MKIIDGRITVLINKDYTTIELHDTLSGGKFAQIKLSPEQLSSALSRLSHTKCEIELHGLDRLNKKMEWQKLVFEIGNVNRFEKDAKSKIFEKGLLACPEGWELDNYFDSQDSFFEKDGIKYARATIRRWVNSEQNPERSVATGLNQGTKS